MARNVQECRSEAHARKDNSETRSRTMPGCMCRPRPAALPRRRGRRGRRRPRPTFRSCPRAACRPSSPPALRALPPPLRGSSGANSGENGTQTGLNARAWERGTSTVASSVSPPRSGTSTPSRSAVFHRNAVSSAAGSAPRRPCSSRARGVPRNAAPWRSGARCSSMAHMPSRTSWVSNMPPGRLSSVPAALPAMAQRNRAASAHWPKAPAYFPSASPVKDSTSPLPAFHAAQIGASYSCIGRQRNRARAGPQTPTGSSSGVSARLPLGS